MNTKHTPGPWQLITPDRGMPWIDSMGGVIADTHSICGSTAHNGRLIASAPELLAALEAIISGWDSPTYGDDADEIDPLVAFASIEKARAAIAKARNE